MSDHNKADQAEIEGLHGLLARTLADAIRSGEPNAAILNVARAFLKDNGVQADIAVNGDLKELGDLPVFDTHEVPHTRQ